MQCRQDYISTGRVPRSFSTILASLHQLADSVVEDRLAVPVPIYARSVRALGANFVFTC